MISEIFISIAIFSVIFACSFLIGKIMQNKYRTFVGNDALSYAFGFITIFATIFIFYLPGMFLKWNTISFVVMAFVAFTMIAYYIIINWRYLNNLKAGWFQYLIILIGTFLGTISIMVLVNHDENIAMNYIVSNSHLSKITPLGNSSSFHMFQSWYYFNSAILTLTKISPYILFKYLDTFLIGTLAISSMLGALRFLKNIKKATIFLILVLTFIIWWIFGGQYGANGKIAALWVIPVLLVCVVKFIQNPTSLNGFLYMIVVFGIWSFSHESLYFIIGLSIIIILVSMLLKKMRATRYASWIGTTFIISIGILFYEKSEFSGLFIFCGYLVFLAFFNLFLSNEIKNKIDIFLNKHNILFTIITILGLIFVSIIIQLANKYHFISYGFYNNKWYGQLIYYLGTLITIFLLIIKREKIYSKWYILTYIAVMTFVLLYNPLVGSFIEKWLIGEKQIEMIFALWIIPITLIITKNIDNLKSEVIIGITIIVILSTYIPAAIASKDLLLNYDWGK